MKLFVDVGNTALKWRQRDGERVRQGGEMHQRHWDQALQAPLAAESALGEVWIASVAGPEADQRIAELVRERSGLEARFYYSRGQDFGVSNCYPEPRRLGVDRWVALVECWQRFGAGIVVDCGSALTIDALDAQGRFMGGYIVPGLGMLRNALLRDTADVHVDQAAASLGLGRSTGECVHNGLLRMSVAFVSDVVVELRQQLPDTCKVLLTGGDAGELAPAFSFDFLHMPDLVLDGLERVAARQD
ncbi:type III pantothenate kinase [Alloalcanivorax mobilis]|uniref:type III pantothenate kinase n=1 Tax=Alloalcanivorax mobilis TaxID=2019569 RepID=UPI000B5B1DD6|nr:type III pantothenate kinase [Alloalcanivorax mobilis]ASK35159.1 type III pantothenate kinase [Alcanivorax sp. N3-2A]|tara:strand:- start:956 stop:1690 length:735 start_codon:yes stop_codon:yes gene_type:complete